MRVFTCQSMGANMAVSVCESAYTERLRASGGLFAK